MATIMLAPPPAWAGSASKTPRAMPLCARRTTPSPGPPSNLNGSLRSLEPPSELEFADWTRPLASQDISLSRRARTPPTFSKLSNASETMSGDKILLAGAAMNGLYGLQIFSDQDKAAGAWE